MTDRILLSTLAVLILASCGQGSVSISRTVEYQYSSDSDMLSYSLDVKLPKETDEVTRTICDTLMAILEDNMDNTYYLEDTVLIARYAGDPSDREAYFDYISKETCEKLRELAEAGRDEIKEYAPDVDATPWSCQAVLEPMDETDRYVIFNIYENVCYGGPHGEHMGDGAITFSKKTGRRVIHFIEPTAVRDMQPLLKAGVLSYLKDSGETASEDELMDMLLVEDGIIPLPVNAAYPSDDGLVLTYLPYEIAPYAMGMPSFTIAYDQARPYLTAEAIDLLEL